MNSVQTVFNSSDIWNLLIFSFLVGGLINTFLKVCFYFIFGTEVAIHYLLNYFPEFCEVITAGYNCVYMPNFPI